MVLRREGNSNCSNISGKRLHLQCNHVRDGRDRTVTLLGGCEKTDARGRKYALHSCLAGHLSTLKWAHENGARGQGNVFLSCSGRRIGNTDVVACSRAPLGRGNAYTPLVKVSGCITVGARERVPVDEEALDIAANAEPEPLKYRR